VVWPGNKVLPGNIAENPNGKPIPCKFKVVDPAFEAVKKRFDVPPRDTVPKFKALFVAMRAIRLSARFVVEISSKVEISS
jgi:hypothetical protein